MLVIVSGVDEFDAICAPMTSAPSTAALRTMKLLKALSLSRATPVRKVQINCAKLSGLRRHGRFDSAAKLPAKKRPGSRGVFVRVKPGYQNDKEYCAPTTQMLLLLYSPTTSPRAAAV